MQSLPSEGEFWALYDCIIRGGWYFVLASARIRKKWIIYGFLRISYFTGLSRWVFCFIEYDPVCSIALIGTHKVLKFQCAITANHGGITRQSRKRAAPKFIRRAFCVLSSSILIETSSYFQHLWIKVYSNRITSNICDLMGIWCHYHGNTFS